MAPKPPAKAQKSSKAETLCGPGPANSNASKEDSDAVASRSQILNAIHTIKVDVVSGFDGNAIQGLQGELKAVSVRVTEAEDRIRSNQDDIASLMTQTNSMKAAIEELIFKWMTWNIGPIARTSVWMAFWRREDGSNMCAFLEKWIPEVLDEHNFPQPVLIERAHRIGGPRH